MSVEKAKNLIKMELFCTRVDTGERVFTARQCENLCGAIEALVRAIVDERITSLKTQSLCQHDPMENKCTLGADGFCVICQSWGRSRS